MKNNIPQPTIEAFSRSIFKEATKYGFGQLDVIKLINELMGLCSDVDDSPPEKETGVHQEAALKKDQFAELPIESPDVHIRPFRGEHDKQLLEKWLPDKYGRYFVLSCATAQEITVESLIQSRDNHLGVVTLPDGTPIGVMAYLDYSRRQRRAELRKLIGEPSARGTGLAAKATKLWIQFGICGLGLEKIYVSTLQTQIANIRLNEKIGFHMEGLLKNEVLIDGERCDVLRMGMNARPTE